MLRSIIALALLGFCGLQVTAAERDFDFAQYPLNQVPRGFKSVVTGQGAPGEWKVMRDDTVKVVEPLAPGALPVRKTVLAQVARDKTDEHFPILMFDEEEYADFTFTTKVKAVDGEAEQMAGVAFRMLDEKNYYVVRASSKGSTFKFYKVIDGQRGQPLGMDIPVARGVWHEISVTARGNQFRVSLNGKEIDTVTDEDHIFLKGKIGFWTKSDSVSYFSDARITYVPIEPLIKVIVRDIMTKYPRLLGLKVFASMNNDPVKVVAADDDHALGELGTDVEKDVLGKGAVYAGKGDDCYSVTLPVRDRNGEVAAAVRVKLRTFKGQTESNAIARATPIAKMMEERLRAAKSLVE